MATISNLSQLQDLNLGSQENMNPVATVVSAESGEVCHSMCSSGQVHLEAKPNEDTLLENSLSTLKTEDETNVKGETVGDDGNEEFRITLTDLPTEVINIMFIILYSMVNVFGFKMNSYSVFIFFTGIFTNMLIFEPTAPYANFKTCE